MTTPPDITPAGPAAGPAMRQGWRRRGGRLATVIGRTAGAIVIVTAVIFGVFALIRHNGGSRAPLVRPVLFVAEPGLPAGSGFGDAHLVNAATLKLFGELTCRQGPDALTADGKAEAALGENAAQWDAPDSEIVSCAASGDKYVLGKAAVFGSQVTSATPVYAAADRRWHVRVTLDRVGAGSLAALTTSLYGSYRPHVTPYATQTSMNDTALDTIAFVVNGNVAFVWQVNAPITTGTMTIPGSGTGFTTRAAAEAFAAQL